MELTLHELLKNWKPGEFREGASCPLSPRKNIMPLKPEVNAVGYLLARAGSDNGFIFLNVADTKLLGLTENTEIIEVEEVQPRMMGYLTPNMPQLETDKDGNVIHPKKKKRAVEAIHNRPDDPDEIIKSYSVNVGFARKALKKILNGRQLDDVRQPDPEIPVTQEEPAAV